MSFRWGKVAVTLSFWFFCGATLLLLWDRSGTSGLFFLAVMIHEGSHLAYMLAAGLPLGEVRLTPLGLVMSLCPGCRPTLTQSLLLNLSGGAGNLLAAALLALWPGGGLPALRFSAVNTALGLVNLLPIPGLDGAEALEDLLLLLLGWERGERLYTLLMKVLCLVGAGGCGWLLLTEGTHLSWLCFLAVFLLGLIKG